MYTDEKQHPGYRIFHDVFSVWIPKLFVRPVEEIEALGTYTTGDLSYDTELENEDVSTVRTAFQLAQLNQMGSRIVLQRPTDSVTIYNLIMEYARLWASAIDNRGLLENIDLYMETEEFQAQQKDIEMLVAFAGEIKPHAETQLPKDLRVNSTMGRFKMLQQRLGRIPTTKDIPKTVLPADAPTPLTESAASDRIRKRNRLW